MTIGEKIITFRKNASLSQDNLAEKLYVSRQTISQWENDQTTPTLENLIRLCEIFNITMNDFFDMETVQKHDTCISHEPFTIASSYTEDDVKTAYQVIHRKRVKPKIGRIVVLTISIIIATLFKSYFTAGIVLILVIKDLIDVMLLNQNYKNTCKSTTTSLTDYKYWYKDSNNYIEVYKFSKDGEILIYEKIRRNETREILNSEEVRVIEYNGRIYIIKK